jgi:7,8-dihydropterin-6-yl-methyl-4-(beta-D-ribofuranosyl)aminobenzene 5'-phosphate synthase
VLALTTYSQRGALLSCVYAVVGGLHLFPATDQQIDWTSDKLKAFGLSYLVGAYCTGINSVYEIRQHLRLPRPSAAVGAVGATFVLGEGIHPGRLAQ